MITKKEFSATDAAPVILYAKRDPDSQIAYPVLVNESGELLTSGGGSGDVNIPQLDSDPVSPTAEEAWVLKSGSGGGIADGTPIGLLLALTYTGNSGSGFTYQFSYRTKEGTTKRVTLT